MWLALILLACSHPCDRREHALRAMVVEEEVLRFVDLPAFTHAAVVDGAGVLWTWTSTLSSTGILREDELVATWDDDWNLEDLAVVGGQAISVEAEWDAGAAGAWAIRLPPDAEPEEGAPELPRVHGALATGTAEDLWFAIAASDDNVHLEGRLARRTEEGWSTWELPEVEGGVSAATSVDERVAVGWGRDTSVWGLGVSEGGASWTALSDLYARQLDGLALDGEGTLWAALTRDGVNLGERDAWLARAGGCQVHLGGLVPPVALTGREEGVTAWGLGPQGVPRRVDAGPDCELTHEALADGVDAPLEWVSSAVGGDTPVVVGRFVVDENPEAFEHPYVPLCY